MSSSLAESVAGPVRRAGRPRDAKIDAVVIATTWRMIEEHGYSELSLDGIAAEAGVSRPALKRRWPSRAAVAVDALIAHTPVRVAPDTGTLRGDLERTMREINRVWSRPRIRNNFTALVADLEDEPEARERFQGLIGRRRADIALAVDRARRRGEVRRGIDMAVVADLLEGPLLHRLLITDAPSTPALRRAALESALAYLTAES